MPIEPMELQVSPVTTSPFVLTKTSTAPFVITGGNESSISLALAPTLTGTPNLQGPQGDPSPRGLHGYCSSTPNANEVVVAGNAPYDFTINSNECYAESLIAATNQVVFVIAVEGIDIGIITFAPGSKVGVFAFTGDLDVVKHDIVTIKAPASSDDTLADISFLLAS